MSDSKERMTLAKRLEPFACGGASATLASVVIHPMDLAKVRRQHEERAPEIRFAEGKKRSASAEESAIDVRRA
jgi:Mitochondrial carrier protein